MAGTNQRWKAVRTDRELECPEIDDGLRAAGCDLVLLPEGISEADLCAEVRDADLLLMCYTPVTARVINAAPNLKGIMKYGVGIDAIDIPAAIARGIPVVNVPEYAEETVAEGAFALMIALAKKLMPIGREMDAKGWAWPTPDWLGLDLAGRTLGLIGTGKIGHSMARMATGFRMRVLGHDPHVGADTMRAGGIEKVNELNALLRDSDFVSIHAVLNDGTRHLIGGLELSFMKPTAFLINVSRGAIVDEEALVIALREKIIAGAALDVFSQEPVHIDHPMAALYEMDNVILFPHLTFYTQEAMARLTADTLARCAEMLEGRPVLVKSRDPRLRAQQKGVVFAD
jgi:D-3-phosphoglycerate dehydrogenase